MKIRFSRPALAAVRLRNLVTILLTALSLVATAPLAAQSSSLPAEKRAQIQKAASNFMAKNSVPGLSAGILLDGQPAWSEGFGLADLENFVPASPVTLFRLGSISKSITAVAVLELYERGKLNIDAEVQKYCQAFPKKDAPITSRELLGHLAGIRHYNPGFAGGDVPLDSARHFNTMQESLQIFANDPLVDKPGNKFHYSTYGYTILGCVLEGASSEKFVDFVKENLFDPAGMAETQADNSSSITQHRTRFYHQESSGPVQNAGVLDSSYKIPGGGFISSADDMMRFATAVLANQLLKPATRDLMWTSQKNADGTLTNYGMGWFVGKKFGLFVAAHTGGQQGTSTSLILVPERHAAAVVLANIEGVNVEALGYDILKIALDLSGAPE
jgi:serine beta-lactamase-like protein LACTB